MIRKSAWLTEVLTNFALSFLCYSLVTGRFVTAVAHEDAFAEGGLVLFFLLAYGLRPFLGAVMDAFSRFHFQSLGCLILFGATLIPPAWTWAIPLTAGVGYALFSTAIGGESLAFARGYLSRCGGILASGIVGSALGICFARMPFPQWVFPGVALGSAVACFFLSETRKFPRRIRSFRHSVSPSVPRWAVLSLVFLPVLFVSLTGSFLPATEFGGYWMLLPALCCAVGRVVGAYGADRFGARKAALVGWGIALPLLTVFTHIPWLYCLGLVALHGAVSTCFGVATAAMPSHPHFVYGAGSVMFLLGSMPSLFSFVITPTLRILCGVLLLFCLIISQVLYTDHCKILPSPYYRRKRGRH